MYEHVLPADTVNPKCKFLQNTTSIKYVGHVLQICNITIQLLLKNTYTQFFAIVKTLNTKYSNMH